MSRSHDAITATDSQGWDTNLQSDGGVKYDQGKLRYDALPVEALEEVVWNYTMGLNKYEIDNWRKGMSFRRMYAAMSRHAKDWMRGEQRDPVDGQHHMAAVVFYALNIMQLEIERPECDDRYNSLHHDSCGFMRDDNYIMERPEL